MAKPNKLKRPANLVLAPPDAPTADIWLARVGTLVREVDGIQGTLDAKVTELRQIAEARATPIKAEIASITQGLQLWAEANRDALTQGGRTKTIELAAGKLAWRTRPASVRLKNVDAVLAALRERQLVQFIRTSEEVDKAAMLRDPDRARTVPGVTIGSEGEEFVVEPLSEPLPSTAGAAA
jgi:phage host-nuclease inhibitor protein Gam